MLISSGCCNNNDVNPTSCFPTTTWSITARPCDSCKSSAALLFCRPDSVFLCLTCDAKIHHQPQPRHERVWICEVCEQAPASVTCKADAAALCFTCDRDIHSANPLASRHERLPVSPIYDTAESLLLKSPAAPVTNPDEKFVEFDYPFTDSVVPVVQSIPQTRPVKTTGDVMNSKKDCYFELDFSNPNGLFNVNVNLNPNPNPTSVSSSACMEAGVVPEGNSIYDTSNSTGKGMDREARVHRYREKRKNRRYDKMIRYASRKAYAESRPRIKGRFAKRTEVEHEEEEEEMMTMMGFGNRPPAGFLELMEAGGYSVVPSIPF